MSFKSLKIVSTKISNRFASLAFALAVGLSVSLTMSQPSHAVEPHEYAEASAYATKALVLDVAEVGARLVAVGEYGHVLLSDDKGANWRQAESVPTRNTLTTVMFVNEQIGYAVGHEATILKTEDGGENWTLQYNERRGENPLFGIYFSSPTNGIAVGGFSVVLSTNDGGASWTPRSLIADSYDDFHLNDIFVGADGAVYIPAEFGTIYRSTDKGVTFETVNTPYDGSFWGGMSLKNGAILVWGMRGNAFVSADGGDTWTKSATNSDRSISGGTQLADGRIVLAGLSGSVLVSEDSGKSFTPTVRSDRKSFATASSGSDDTVLLYGDPGILSHALSN